MKADGVVEAIPAIDTAPQSNGALFIVCLRLDHKSIPQRCSSYRGLPLYILVGKFAKAFCLLDLSPVFGHIFLPANLGGFGRDLFPASEGMRYLRLPSRL